MQGIVALMRVRNEEKFLAACLQSMEEVCSDVFLLDGGSTDRTPEIAKSFSNIHYLRDSGESFDETRDFNKLYAAFKASGLRAEWLMVIDADEELEPIAGQILQKELPRIPRFFNVVRVHWPALVGDKRQYLHNPVKKRLLFRVSASKSLEIAAGQKAHVHFPTDFLQVPFDLDLRLKHYGWLDDKKIQQKFEMYRRAGLFDSDPEAVDEWLRQQHAPGVKRLPYADRAWSEYKPFTSFALLTQAFQRVLIGLKEAAKSFFAQ